LDKIWLLRVDMTGSFRGQYTLEFKQEAVSTLGYLGPTAFEKKRFVESERLVA